MLRAMSQFGRPVPMRALAVSMLAVALATTACGAGAPTPSASATATEPARSAPPNATSASPIPSVEGCVPECLPQRVSAERPVGAGPFTTRNFFAGALTITLDEGWTVEDGTNELVFHHAGPPDWFIFVWIDPYPVANLRRVDGVERTPAALVAWLRANPTLIAAPAEDTTVANGIRAAAVDLRVSDKATIEVSDCPDLCTNYFGFENGPDAHGLARPGVTRIYLAPITYGGQSHLLTVSYEAVDPTSFADQLEHAHEIIGSIRMPVEAATTGATSTGESPAPIAKPAAGGGTIVISYSSAVLGVAPNAACSLIGE